MADPQWVLKFGRTLGLNETFLRSVAVKGQLAIIDRIEAVDQSGAHVRLLSLVQQFGHWMLTDWATRGQSDPMEMGDAINMLARLHGINPQLATRLVGAILEVMRMTIERVATEELETPENAKNAVQS